MKIRTFFSGTPNFPAKRGTQCLDTLNGLIYINVNGQVDGWRSEPGPVGARGTEGLSAYQVAVNGGFVGTEQGWLASLVGAKGEIGIAGPAGPQGIPGAWTMLKKTTDQNGIDARATDISDLTVAVLAGQTLRFHAFLRVTNSDVAIGAMISCNGPATNFLTYRTVEWLTAASVVFNHGTSFDAFSSLVTGPGTTPVIYELIGIGSFSAGGTFAVRAKSGVLGTMNVLAGSHMEYDLS